MPDVLFYHLQRQPLEKVLPQLVEKTLARGWRAVIRTGSAERLQALDDLLWTYRDDSFLPHGTLQEGDPASQPVFLTTEDEAPNAADCAFVTDGAPMPSRPFERVVLLFDGNDDEALARARISWKDVKARGIEATYWQQDDNGRWERRA